MDMKLQGDIRKFDYDNIQDIERLEFKDQNLDFDIYLEIPRSIITLEGESSINILITDNLAYEFSKPKIVFNSTLYLVTRLDEQRIVQFSAGGLILRIITAENQKTPFRLRGNRQFKIIVE